MFWVFQSQNEIEIAAFVLLCSQNELKREVFP